MIDGRRRAALALALAAAVAVMRRSTTRGAPLTRHERARSADAGSPSR